MCDEPAPTLIRTKGGTWLGFQDYFVREKCQPEIAEIVLLGNEQVVPSEPVVKSLEEADLVVLAPSNPWVSIDPILKLTGVREILMKKTVVAVSPIIQATPSKVRQRKCSEN